MFVNCSKNYVTPFSPTISLLLIVAKGPLALAYNSNFKQIFWRSYRAGSYCCMTVLCVIAARNVLSLFKLPGHHDH